LIAATDVTYVPGVSSKNPCKQKTKIVEFKIVSDESGDAPAEEETAVGAEEPDEEEATDDSDAEVDPDVEADPDAEVDPDSDADSDADAPIADDDATLADDATVAEDETTVAEEPEADAAVASPTPEEPVGP